MRPDPLDFFEKFSAGPVSDEKLDAGEEALAGLSVAASIVAIQGEKVVGFGLRHLMNKGETFWPAHSPGEFSTVKDTLKALNRTRPGLPAPQPKNLLGLFPIKERVKDFGADELNRAITQMKRMEPTVDSFIKKHDLPGRGVTMKFKRGLLSGGPLYDLSKKRVMLPSFSEATTLHELGHAADFTGSRRSKIWGMARGPVKSAVAVALPIALIAGDEIKRALPGTVDDRVIEFMQQNAPAILGATLAATQLYPEGKATAMALKHIKTMKGPRAMRAAAKTLLPAWGTYALMTIAPMIGMSLAKKYYNQTKEKQLEKEGSVLTDYVMGQILGLKSVAKDIMSIGGQIGKGTKDLITHPGRMKRIGQAAKEVGTSREFVEGALYAGIPATLATAYIYGQRHGPVVREKLQKVAPYDLEDLLRTGGLSHRAQTYAKDKVPEDWKRQNPGLYAGLVGAGAAMSGGILMKLFSDLTHAM